MKSDFSNPEKKLIAARVIHGWKQISEVAGSDELPSSGGQMNERLGKSMLEIL